MVNSLVIKNDHISTIQCLFTLQLQKEINLSIEIELNLCEKLILANHKVFFLKVIIMILCNLYSKNKKRFFLEFQSLYILAHYLFSLGKF